MEKVYDREYFIHVTNSENMFNVPSQSASHINVFMSLPRILPPWQGSHEKVCGRLSRQITMNRAIILKCNTST